MKIIEQNKKAYFDYFIEDTFEAGISLVGSEVKSIRAGNLNIRDAFCFVENGEIVLKNLHISPYEKGSYFNEDPRRDRKLLLHKAQINRLIGKIREKGYTIVPTKIYFSKSLVKVELGLAKGKHTYDKSQTLKEKQLMRQAERDIKQY